MSKEWLEEAIRAIKSNWPDERYSLLRDALDYVISEAERVQELEEEFNNVNNLYIETCREIWLVEQDNKRYREAREIIEQVYKESYVINSYGYEDGYLDGLDTAINIIDEALEESE